TIEFHKGKLIYGEIKGKKVIAMQGRFHYYEGYDLSEITFPVRVMKFLGIKNILISNAGGAMNLNYKKGSLMLLDDHINMIPDSPLRGKEYREFGSRFVDLSQPYSKTLNQKLLAIAKEKNILLHQGIYVAVAGPQLETRAEYRFFRSTGADVVGMSTVPEAIVAKQMGLPCAAISVITDECDPDDLKEVNISEILKIAGKAEVGLIELFVSLIEGL
ncbi:MAG: purine-nucleoside phosphorylase, partial [Bacteroidales bacterium]|nr:purine-nucleoside phosphorylase [Bacteroidales bacterium]